MDTANQVKKIKREIQDLRLELMKCRSINEAESIKARIAYREKFVETFDQQKVVVRKVRENSDEDAVWLAVGGSK